MAEQHTPLPWKAVTPCPGECCWNLVPASFDESALQHENWHERITLPEMSEADAKFIVQCVNAHDGLVEALRRIAGQSMSQYASALDMHTDAAVIACAALAKAGEQS